MIQALLLIFGRNTAWEKVTLSKRGMAFTVLFHLLPMMLIVGLAEGIAMVKWGKIQSAGMLLIKYFTVPEAIVYESAQMLVMAVVLVVSAYLIKSIGETFHGGHTYRQSFTVVIYGLSPLFLFRLLDVFPAMNLWIPWGIGMLFVVKILYRGVPRVMEPSPTNAFGLYLMSCVILIMATGIERGFAFGCLTGRLKPAIHVLTNIALKLQH